ncbi:MAG: PBP1A family penicillin-binding protein [Pseudomonadota bacterium]
MISVGGFLRVGVSVLMLIGLAPVSFLAGGVIGAITRCSDELPEIPQPADYRPKTVTTFYADGGTIIGVFYKQKRFVVDLDRVPFHASHAFIAAEDSRFFDHHGADWRGIARAVFKNAMAFKVQQGASTITQQVARQVFLTNDRTISRKIREMLLARKIEQLWGKQEILYVYLNEIYLGDQCYGIEAAARNYFDKHVGQLSIAEAALLAGIVPSPSKYNPFKNRHMSVIKQRLVLGNMLTSGVITEEEYEKALAEKLKFRTKAERPFDIVPDFTEAVRRYVVKKYGESRVYQEGLKVYTTCRLEDQQRAIQSLKQGLDEIKGREKQHTLLRNIKKEDVAGFLGGRSIPKLSAGHDYQGLVTGVSQSPKGTRLHVSLDELVHGHVNLPKRSSAYTVGHLLSLTFEKYENSVPVFVQAEDPPLQGALVCIENGTGFVRALVGGSSRDHFQFNRATQAKRRPGSVFKPIIYAAALEQFGYTPATVIVDEPVVIKLKGLDQDWVPNNADRSFLGPISVRRALENSRNICTIKILMDVGFDAAIQLARRMGIRSELERNLSLSLGTSETSLYELTSAYTVFPNGGIFLEPVLVKKIEDRYGNLLEDNTRITRLDEGLASVPSLREKPGKTAVTPVRVKTLGKARLPQVECPSPEDPMQVWPSGRKSFGRLVNDLRAPQASTATPAPNACPPPRPRLEQPALSPQTAFIMTSLLQGVVRSGTGAGLAKYTKRRDLCGKTGTTDNSDDAWFIGYNPNYTTGVWVGFDDNRTLGREETGAQAALPIWGYFMNGLLEGSPQKKYPVPEKLVRRSMPTVVFDKGTGTVIGTTMEHVYAPLSGKTLTVSPLDSLEAIQVALAEAEQVREQRAMAGRLYEATYVPNQHGPIPVVAGSALSPQDAAGSNPTTPPLRSQPVKVHTWPGAARAQPIPAAAPISNP